MQAAELALADAGIEPGQVDALITGYSTVASHLMPANLFAERFGIRPATAFGMSSGGATGLAMLVQAARLVESGSARHVLVAAGENRASGQSRETSTRVLAQVGHAAYEVPLGGTVPAYYALLASRYLWTYGLEPGVPGRAAGADAGARRQAPRSPVPEADHGRGRRRVAAGRRAAAAARLLPGLRWRRGVRRLGRADLRPVAGGGRYGSGAPPPAPVRARAGQDWRRARSATGAGRGGGRVGCGRRLRDLRQLLDHGRDPGRGAGARPTRAGGGLRASRRVRGRRPLPDEHARRSAVLRPLRGRRRDGARRRGGVPAPQRTRRWARWPAATSATCTPTVGCCPRTWGSSCVEGRSGDERAPRRLDRRRARPARHQLWPVRRPLVPAARRTARSAARPEHDDTRTRRRPLRRRDAGARHAVGRGRAAQPRSGGAGRRAARHGPGPRRRARCRRPRRHRVPAGRAGQALLPSFAREA